MNNYTVDDIANSLNNEVVLLNLKWEIYRGLFNCSQRQALLCCAAPILFTLLQKLLLDDIAITLCRITDSAETKTKSETHQNNTLYQLLSKKGLDQKSLDKVKKNLDEVKIELNPVRTLRNKFIAHKDLDLTLEHFLANTSDSVTTFSLNFPLSLENIGVVIEKINGVMNDATNQHVLYNHIRTPYGPDGGVKTLIDHLKAALFYESLRKMDKFDSSNFYEDWQHFEHKNA